MLNDKSYSAIVLLRTPEIIETLKKVSFIQWSTMPTPMIGLGVILLTGFNDENADLNFILWA